jgi:hypothetical protein
MLKAQRRHLFAGVAIALAAVGCAPEEQEEVGALRPRRLAQSISVISGYDVSVEQAQYTLRGYIMPRWNAPSSHSPIDWVGIYKVGASETGHENWQYVGRKGSTSGIANQIRIPAQLSTSSQYEVRYQLRGVANKAAYAGTFTLIPTPSISCGSSEPGTEVPEAHWVNLGKSSGTVSFNFDAGTTEDRIQVWSDDTLLYDSGCVSGARATNIPYTNGSNRLLVTSLPMCDLNDGSSDYTWSMGCPP